jgi:hypothetical protein
MVWLPKENAVNETAQGLVRLDGSQSPTAGRKQFSAVATANCVQQAVGSLGDFDYSAHGVHLMASSCASVEVLICARSASLWLIAAFPSRPSLPFYLFSALTIAPQVAISSPANSKRDMQRFLPSEVIYAPPDAAHCSARANGAMAGWIDPHAERIEAATATTTIDDFILFPLSWFLGKVLA